MIILTTASQDTIVMSSVLLLQQISHEPEKKPNLKTNRGLYITHLKQLLEVCYSYLPLYQASIQNHDSRNTGTNEDCFSMDLCLWLITSVYKVQALIEAGFMSGIL